MAMYTSDYFVSNLVELHGLTEELDGFEEIGSDDEDMDTKEEKKRVVREIRNVVAVLKKFRKYYAESEENLEMIERYLNNRKPIHPAEGVDSHSAEYLAIVAEGMGLTMKIPKKKRNRDDEDH